MKFLIIIMILIVFSSFVQAYGGSYNSRTEDIVIQGTYNTNEQIFLHEWGHSFWFEEMTWVEKSRFSFRKEEFATVYQESFTCKLNVQADERVKKLVWWKR